MTVHKKRDFCVECRTETEYSLQKKDIVRTIRGKAYTFRITVAVCAECGTEMDVPGLIDRNIREFDEQYREIEGLVSVADIEKLMKLYQLGKAPLSLALGFGEVTVPRYLEGQVPSKEYSDILHAALASPAYMKSKLAENRKKMTGAAYQRATNAADRLEKLFCVSEKMLQVIAYLFEKLEEVTPLSLQKLLYFIQGIYSALYGKPLFSEDCRAWIHGPVYQKVYNLFRDFKYNPIDDERFALLEGTANGLSKEEKGVIDLVVNTFGMYGGKVLERITHNEMPWKEARNGYADGIPSSEIMQKERIMRYYDVAVKRCPTDCSVLRTPTILPDIRKSWGPFPTFFLISGGYQAHVPTDMQACRGKGLSTLASYYMAVNQTYGIDTEDGLRAYIRDMLAQAS